MTETMDQLETRMAQACGALIQTILTAARCNAADQESVAAISDITQCRLSVALTPQAIQIELIAPINGAMRVIYDATFENVVSLQ